MKNKTQEPKGRLSAIKGLQMGWCLFHQIPMDGIAENKKFTSDLKKLKDSFFYNHAVVPPEELQYSELVTCVLFDLRSDVENMQKLMKSPSMDAIGAGEVMGEKIILAQRFGLISLHEAIEIHEAGQATSFKYYPIGDPRRLRLPYVPKVDTSYRELVIEKIVDLGKTISVNFANSVVGFGMSKKWLRQHGANIKSFIPGRSILIKGKKGNSDVSLWGEELENIVLVPVIKE